MSKYLLIFGFVIVPVIGSMFKQRSVAWMVYVSGLMLLCSGAHMYGLNSDVIIGGGLISGVMFAYAIYFLETVKTKYKIKIQWRVPLEAVSGKKYYIEDLNKGVVVLGASGSGKSASVIQAIMQHCAEHNFAGVIHDYKDFELTEVAGTLFTEKGTNFKVFAIHAVNDSVRINPISPCYLESENAVRGLVQNLFLNLKGVPKGDTFFRSAAEGLVVGLIWRLKNEFPELCNLPFVVAILLQVDSLHGQQGDKIMPYQKLINFIMENKEAATKASSFLSGVASEKQTAAVYATLTDTLQVLDSPNVFFLLSGNDIDLHIFENDNRTVLSVVNKPGVETVCQAPINAMIIDIVMNLTRRGNKEGIILLDEAPTIKIYGLEQRVATLRSYGIGFVYAMQDLVQGRAQWDGKDIYIKSTTANLSTQFLGKINDPETGEYYEKYLELVKEKQYSYSNGSILSKGDGRTTKSFKDRKKIRGFEFHKLRVGQFVMITDGQDHTIQFKYNTIAKYSPPQMRFLTENDVRNYYTKLLSLAALFIEGGYETCYNDILEQFKKIQK